MKKNLVIIGFIFICIALATSCSKDSKYVCKCTIDTATVYNYDIHNLPGQYYEDCEEFAESLNSIANDVVCQHVH